MVQRVWSDKKSMRFFSIIHAISMISLSEIRLEIIVLDLCQLVYQIVVNDGKKSEYSQQINPEYLTRQVEDTGVKLTPIFKSETSGENTETRFEGFSDGSNLWDSSRFTMTHLNNASHTDGRIYSSIR